MFQLFPPVTHRRNTFCMMVQHIQTCILKKVSPNNIYPNFLHAVDIFRSLSYPKAGHDPLNCFYKPKLIDQK